MSGTETAHGSGGTGSRRLSSRRRRQQPAGWRGQLPLLAVIMTLWVLLWDDLSWGNVANGALIAVLLTRLFHLPPAELSGRVNLYWSAVFLGYFFVDLARSSLQVARLALRFGHTPRNAVVAVRLHTSSDLLLTITANALTLIPGSSIIDVDRLNHTLYVHVLDAPDDEAVERSRRHIKAMEERMIRAIGSRVEFEALVRDKAAAGGGGQR